METPRGRLSLAQTPALLNERAPRSLPGWSVLVAVVILLVAGIALLSRGLVERFHGPGASNAVLAIGVPLVAIALAGLRGLLSVTPGEAVVLRLAGSYQGTVREPGLWWVHPAARRDRVSTRIRNHETACSR
jgi:hypothetical protein